MLTRPLLITITITIDIVSIYIVAVVASIDGHFLIQTFVPGAE